MPFDERAAGAGFQVTLKAVRFDLRREFHGNDQMPRTIPRRMYVLTGIVPIESEPDVAGHADVVTRGVALAAKDVDESSFPCYPKRDSTL